MPLYLHNLPFATDAAEPNICMIQKGQVFGADEHLYAFENFKTLMAS